MTEIISEIDAISKKLFPIARSITGPGNRDTLKIIQELVPIEIHEYPSGTNVYDWVIPDEWIVRDAWIKNSQGKKLINFKACNVHLVNYSRPMHCTMNFSELKDNLYYSDDLPDAIPYRTTYYKKDWGFCLSKNQYQDIANEKEPLEIFIDTEFKSDGSLTIGELLIPGKFEQEILISTYFCHPSLANDNLSGTVMTAFLAREMMSYKKLNYSYRIIFVPETIGAIAYCANNESEMKNIDVGIVVTCVGGKGKYGYKQSFTAEHPINSFIEEVFKEGEIEYITYPFDIHGSDERQYSSQGIGINTASITKDKYYEYKYYHTSLDNLDFVTPENIAISLGLYEKLIKKLDRNMVYTNLVKNCEVMLSKHELYPSTGGALIPEEDYSSLDIRLWLLFLCDGKRSLYSISNKLKVSIDTLYKECEILVEKGIMISSPVTENSEKN